MRAVMAVRARAMDHTLRRVAAGRHVPVDSRLIGSGFFAEDGFHPSSKGYSAWADALAAGRLSARGPLMGVVGSASVQVGGLCGRLGSG